MRAQVAGQRRTTVDTTVLGQLAAATMGALSEAFGEDVVIRDVVIVAEVDMGSATAFTWQATDDRPWKVQAFLGEALDAMDRVRERQIRASEGDSN